MLYFFTDAAREDGTGFGGHATIQWEGDEQPTFYFLERRWQADALTALQHNTLSMPAGEAFGAVVLADALLSKLPRATHCYAFTDSDATAKAFTTAGSGAPQLNLLVQWLVSRHKAVQFLGVWQPGLRNPAADDLSRTAEGKQRVLTDVVEAGAIVHEITPDEAAASLLTLAMGTPLRH